jgi:hypothetical protein
MAASSYFPWGGDEPVPSASPPYGASSSYTGGPSNNNLAVSHSIASGSPRGPSLLNTRRTPPPPRRVQSEAQVTRMTNPRGIATRNGVPVVTDDQLPASDEGEDKEASPAARKQVGTGAGGPRMSLGPQGAEKLGEGEVLNSPMAPKRKAD